MTRGLENIKVPGEVIVPSEGSQDSLKASEILAETSKSICPVCLRLIDCQILFRENKVYMHKTCSDHGSFESMVYSSVDDYLMAEKYNKPGKTPLHNQGKVTNGCPSDCGLCEQHNQHTCVGIIEINDRCNLQCPVCFADSTGSYSLSFDRVKEMIDLYVKCEGEPEVLQISGGEPTLHPDIIQILTYAGKKGIMYPMLNTNGIKLADREFAEKISNTVQDNDLPIGAPLIYLQFDGLSNSIYKALRGRPLLDLKMKTLANCREFGMNVVLVPTIVKGINDTELCQIIELALSDDNIKMVNFQPSTLVGRYQLENHLERRMTIPDILTEIERQTKSVLKKDSFVNIPCPYPTCSVCNYIYKDDGQTIALTDLLEVGDYMDYVVNRTLPDIELLSEAHEALDSLLSMSAVVGSEKTEKAICTTCGIAIPKIKELADKITLISVHAFMDEHNFDLKRAQKCCVTEILPNGQMIPFCVYNILYRKQLTPTFKNI